MESIFKNIDTENLPADELTPTEIALLRQKLDRDRQQKWAAELAKRGIRREPAVGLFFNKKNLMAWAVAATLLLGAASAFWLWSRTGAAQKPVAEAANGLPHFTFQGNFRGRNSASEDFVRAVKAYEAGHFDEALSLAKPFEAADKSAKTAFLAGLCCIFNEKSPDFGAAIAHFDTALACPDAPIEARIYRAFALQKSGRTQEARTELEALKNHPQIRGPFAKAVQDLLKKE